MPYAVIVEAQTDMLTPFALGSAAVGGALVLEMPAACGAILSLRYPVKRVPALDSQAQERGRGEKAAERDVRPKLVVIEPQRLEILRAARERRRTPDPGSGISQVA